MTAGAPDSSRRPRPARGPRRRTPWRPWPTSPANPGRRPKDLFGLFNEAYPQPADGSRRSAPFVPYLAYAPDDFALSLAFAGGGMFANGRFMFDTDGNLWSGQNWMPGSQSGAVNSIGGGVLKMSPNGVAAVAADHRLHRHGHRWHRLGHRRDQGPGLGLQFQRQAAGDGLRRQGPVATERGSCRSSRSSTA